MSQAASIKLIAISPKPVLCMVLDYSLGEPMWWVHSKIYLLKTHYGGSLLR